MDRQKHKDMADLVNDLFRFAYACRTGAIKRHRLEEHAEELVLNELADACTIVGLSITSTFKLGTIVAMDCETVKE